MNKSEIKKAEKLLENHAERTDTMINGKGQALTAYWHDGGQQIFYAIDDVEAWVADHR